MKVLIMNWKDLAHPHAGGAEVYTEEIARNWAAQGDDVTLFAAAVEGRPAQEVVEGVQIVRRGGRFSVYREARRYYQEQGRGAFDVVLDGVNTRPFLTPTYVAEPVVALIHQVCREIWFDEMLWPVAVVGRYWLEPRWLKRYRTTRVVTVSASSKESLESYGLTNVRVVPMGLAARPLPDHEKESVPTAVFVGRLAANKGPLKAVEAFRLAQKEIPDAQLWVVGSGPQDAEVRQAAGSGVTVWGKVPSERRDELMGRAHVLVATSVREGWGMVVDEAAVLGTPTVGFDVPGLRDSVPAAGGTLTKADPPSLAEGLITHLRQPVQQDRTRHGARAWAEVAEVIRAELETACQGHAAPRRARG